MIETLPLILPSQIRMRLDADCSLIMRELEKRDWQVPGIKVSFAEHHPGELDGMPNPGHEHRFVSQIRIPGEDCVLWFGTRDRGWNFNLLYAIAIPQKTLLFNIDLYPEFNLYVGDCWTDDRHLFIKGDVLRKDSACNYMNGRVRTSLRYVGSAFSDRIGFPSEAANFFEFPNANRLNHCEYLVNDLDYGRNWQAEGDEPKFLKTAEVIAEFEDYIRKNLLDRITFQG